MNVTRDALFAGRITMCQPKHGYRTNVDALHLAAFASTGGRVALAYDLGAGVGAISLALCAWDVASRVVLVERDQEAVGLARENMDLNAWTARTDVVHGSVDTTPADVARLVVCNPPYQRPGAGRAPKATVADARTGDLAPFVRCARRVLGPRGRACFVYPAYDLSALFTELLLVGLHPKRLRFVHAKDNRAARIVLVDARPGRPGGIIVEPSFIERHAAHDTAALKALLRGDVPTPATSSPT